MEKVLVTGAAGYLGSVLVGHLLRSGYKVTALDSLYYQQPSLLQYAGHTYFTFIRGDVRDEPLVKSLLAKHEIVIPLAALVGVPACNRDPIMARTVNLDAIRMLNRLRGAGQMVVSPCTNSGYGTKSGDTFCTEESPLEPISLYGETKVQAEAELMSKSNTISLRLATVFGPSQRIRLDLLVNDFVYKAVTEGSLVIFEKDFKRNFVHIDDVAECFCYCLKNFQQMKNQVYNLGLNDANLSKAELANKIKEHIPRLYIHYAEIGSDPDKRNYMVSNDKLKGQGFEARRSLDEGIKQLVNAYQMIPHANFRNA